MVFSLDYLICFCTIVYGESISTKTLNSVELNNKITQNCTTGRHKDIQIVVLCQISTQIEIMPRSNPETILNLI